MPIEFSRRDNSPLLINEAFVNRCGKLVADLQSLSLAKIASEEGLTPSEMAKISDNSPISSGSKKYSELHIARSRMRQLIPSYSMSFADGTTITSSSIEEILQEMNDSGTECFSISISAGEYSGCRFKLSVDTERFKTLNLSIYGSIQEVNHLKAEFSRIFYSAVPEFKFLHNSNLWYTVFFAFFGAWFGFILVQFWDLLNADYSPASLFPIFVFSLIIPVGIVAHAIEGLKKTFPTVSFEFGVSLRRARTARSFLYFVSSVVVFPSLFLIVEAMIRS